MVQSRTRRVPGLPLETSSFLGRRAELKSVKQCLAGYRLVTITGIGGVGKTRLALRTADAQHRTWSHGVHLIPLGALSNPDLLATTVASAIGLDDRQRDVTTASIADHLQDKRMLLVLDNCEHLLDACAELLEQVLRTCPNVQVIATSRQPLSVEGENVFALDPLPVPEPEAEMPASALLQFPGVQLFCDRAAAVANGFALTEENQDVVAQICRRLDGIPLAIELAAVRVRTLGVDDLLALLTRRFDVLTGGSRAAPTRQQTLRASLDWSFDLCAETEQKLWARLAVFRGSFDLGAATGVCGGSGLPDDQVFDVLAQLVDKSICQREEGSGSARFRLMGTIRAYGLERLTASGEAERYRRRHAEWFVQLSDLSRERWLSSDQPELIHRLIAERANLRAALGQGLSDPGFLPHAGRMAVSLGEFWLAHGLLTEGLHWTGQLLERLDDQWPLRVELLSNDALLAIPAGDWTRVGRRLAEADRLARDGTDERALAAVGIVAGVVEMFNGEAAKSTELLDEALSRARAAADERGVIHALWYLTAVAVFAGQPDAGRRHGEECLEYLEAVGETWIRSSVIYWLGLLTWQDGDPERAADLHAQALGIRMENDDPLGVALGLEALAWIAGSQGDPARAAYLLGAADTLWETTTSSAAAARPLGDFRNSCEESARAGLGPSGYKKEWERGHSEDTAKAVRHALGLSPDDAASSDDEFPLTRRESEVAALIAEGRTDRQVAATLVISRRTAEWHVERILNKLGFTSRSQVAAWWATEGKGRA